MPTDQVRSVMFTVSLEGSATRAEIAQIILSSRLADIVAPQVPEVTE